jgi:uncharacterized protein YgiM (DUF1202 family)
LTWSIWDHFDEAWLNPSLLAELVFFEIDQNAEVTKPDESPPAPPAPQPPAGVCSVSSDGNVNIRSGSGLTNPVVNMLYPGVFLTANGSSSDGWYRVDFSGGTGWVSGTVVQLHGPCDTLLVASSGSTAPVPPAPAPGTPSADLALTDIFPQNANGPLMFRITNRGPDTLTNAKVSVVCNLTTKNSSGQPTGSEQKTQTHTVSLAQGHDQAYQTGFSTIDTSQHQYDVGCAVQYAHDPTLATTATLKASR